PARSPSPSARRRMPVRSRPAIWCSCPGSVPASPSAPRCGAGVPRHLGEATMSERVALITGASGGIGSACARALAAAGHRVAVGYGASAGAADKVCEAIAADGGTAMSVAIDVTGPEPVDPAVAAGGEARGPVEVLAHAAGVHRAQPAGPPRDAEQARTPAPDPPRPLPT